MFKLFAVDEDQNLFGFPGNSERVVDMLLVGSSTFSLDFLFSSLY